MKHIILISIISLIFLIGCQTEIMNNCKNYFDGCNTCIKDNQGNNVCTEIYCEEYEEARCLDNEKTKKSCTREYMPVCGEIKVQCVTPPCEQIKKTFPNMCEAENAKTINIIKGECPTNEAKISLERTCTKEGGIWLEKYNECEFISKEICEKIMKGKFYECGSACRNDPKAEICTLQCVPFCKI